MKKGVKKSVWTPGFEPDLKKKILISSNIGIKLSFKIKFALPDEP